MDVRRDGIALYEDEDTELHEPKPKTPAQALAMAQDYFEEWFPAAAGMLETARFSQSQGRLKDAAFLMHQSADRLYHCVLLVCSFYTPHVHKLGFLRIQAERLDRRLVYVWPTDNRTERGRFEKLKEAYVKARYSKHYRITVEDLAWMGAQIDQLGHAVLAICQDRIIKLEECLGLVTSRDHP
jgi:HEPN domain-containing protein